MSYYQIQTFFSWVAASVAAATVNSNGIKTLLANGNPLFSNGPKSLPKNPPDCPILCIWVFDNFILAEELIAKALQSLKIYVLLNNNLYGKLFSSIESPTILDKNFKVTSVPCFVWDFNLLSCKLNKFTFKVSY